MIKIGRNDPCPCGSGRKYKRSCSGKISMEQKAIPEEALIALKKQSEEQGHLKNKGIYINYVKPLVFKGNKIWAIGSRLYCNRPPNETFHEFIIDILRISLGKEWWGKNIRATEKHFIVESFLRFCEWQKNTASDSSKISETTWDAIPDGWTRSLLSLAFDIATLQHIQKFPEGLLKRLKNKDQYQGARYEIAIAAIFARLDCEIHFLDDQGKSSKHCEFIATHRPSNTEIAVEAKSRHRPGVIHMPGISEEEKLLRGDVGRLLKEALEQNPGDRPFVIFIDLNSPLTPNIEMQEKPWFQDIQKIMSDYQPPTTENPDSYNALFFTNYSFHYQTKREADPGEHLFIIPLYSKHSLPADFLKIMGDALDNYGNVPNLDIEVCF